MGKKFLWSSYNQGRLSNQARGRSKRTYEYDFESAVRLRKKVFLTILALIAIYLAYLFFYSSQFRIIYLNISGWSEMPSEEIESLVWDSLKRPALVVFPGDNYFLINPGRIQKKFDEQGILVQVEATKGFPHTLNVNLADKLGQLVWISNEQFYAVNLNGIPEKQLPIKELVNAEYPVVYDLSNSVFDLNRPIITQELVNLILEAYTTFGSYELPTIELDYFKVDSPDANYVKMVTKNGFEIHVNYLASFAAQMSKLRKSLVAGKIDLNKVNYINLRIENQVIYK